MIPFNLIVPEKIPLSGFPNIILQIDTIERGLIIGALLLALVMLFLLIFYLFSERRSSQKLKTQIDQSRIELIEKYEIQKALFQGSVDPIIIFSSENQVADFNKAAEEFFGYNFHRLIGKAFPGNKSFSNKMVEWMKSFKKGVGISGFNTFIRNNSGDIIPVSLSISPIFNVKGELTYMFFWYRDTRKDYEFQKALQQSEESYKRLFENVNDAILILRKSDKRIIDANKLAFKMYGFEYLELINSTLGIISNSIFDDYRQLEDIIAGNLKFGESTHKRKDGSQIHIEFNASVMDYKGHDAIIMVLRDITERRNYQEQLQKSLKEKEVLLREVHHRVKNNLQLITSLLDLQISSTKDQEAIKIFLESQNRIRVMSIVYERLYESDDLHTIDNQKFVQNITNYLYGVYNGGEKNVHLDFIIDRFPLEIETAVPIALILCELVTNSLKYAFPERSYANTIEIRYSRSFNNKTAPFSYQLSIKDNGGTFPANVIPENTSSLGLQLVYILSKQIKGKVSYDFNGGTEFRIEYAGV
jgi:PAS domain S-box-containing protein